MRIVHYKTWMCLLIADKRNKLTVDDEHILLFFVNVQIRSAGCTFSTFNNNFISSGIFQSLLT